MNDFSRVLDDAIEICACARMFMKLESHKFLGNKQEKHKLDQS